MKGISDLWFVTERSAAPTSDVVALLRSPRPVDILQACRFNPQTVSAKVLQLTDGLLMVMLYHY
jgi:hypothetical protein